MSIGSVKLPQLKNLDSIGGSVAQPAGDSNAAKKTASTEQTGATGQQTGTTGQGGTTEPTPPAVKAQLPPTAGKILDVQS